MNFQVWVRVESEKVEKPLYAEWKREAKENMEERVRAYGQRSHLASQLNTHKSRLADESS